MCWNLLLVLMSALLPLSGSRRRPRDCDVVSKLQTLTFIVCPVLTRSRKRSARPQCCLMASLEMKLCCLVSGITPWLHCSFVMDCTKVWTTHTSNDTRNELNCHHGIKQFLCEVRNARKLRITTLDKVRSYALSHLVGSGKLLPRIPLWPVHTRYPLPDASYSLLWRHMFVFQNMLHQSSVTRHCDIPGVHSRS